MRIFPFDGKSVRLEITVEKRYATRKFRTVKSDDEYDSDEPVYDPTRDPNYDSEEYDDEWYE